MNHHPDKLITTHLLLTLLCCLLFCLMPLSKTYAESKHKYASVGEYLKDQQTIRVVADFSASFGELAATSNVMSRLRQLGFSGTYEVIFDDKNIQGMIKLFDLPVSDISGSYEDQHHQIRFITFSEYLKRYQSHTVEHVNLGVSGALFDYPHLFWNTPMNPDDETSNFANFMNTDLFIRYNPWLPIHDLYTLVDCYQSLSYRFNNKHTYITMPVATLASAKEFLNHDPHGQLIKAKDAALDTFITQMENQQVNVMPVYGWQINKKLMNDQYNQYSPSNMLQIIAGARYAQINGPDSFRNKPLIIAVYYDFEEESAELMKLIQKNDWSDYTNIQGSAQARDLITQLGLMQPSVFNVASLSKPETIAIIKNLKPGQILLLSMGAFPQIVFDGLYTYTADNIWPQIREGANSLNSLITTGRPHIRCSNDYYEKWEPGYSLMTDTALQSRLQSFYNNFCTGDWYYWQYNSNVHQSLGELIIDAHDPNSAFSRYFQVLKVEVSKPENDRISLALTAVLKARKLINK